MPNKIRLLMVGLAGSLLITLFSTGCSSTSGAPTSTTPPIPLPGTQEAIADDETEALAEDVGTMQDNLRQALTLLPAGVIEFHFSDWSLIKQQEGFGDLSSADSLEIRMEFMQQAFSGHPLSDPPVAPRQALFSAYGASYFPSFSETWGWDSTDLVWEATIRDDGAPAYVLQFDEHFDFAPLKALFEQRGYSQSAYQDATIYSHEMDLAADWIRTGDLAIVNTAVQDDAHRLVLSTGLEEVQAILDGSTSLLDTTTIRAIAARLGESAGVSIKVGTEACLTVDQIDEMYSPIAQHLGLEQAALLDEILGRRVQLEAFAGWGVGYHYQGEELIGTIVLHYGSQERAEADLALRRQMVEEGFSWSRGGRSYREMLFALDDARVENGAIVFKVSPVNGMPRHLVDMVAVRDMLFATCP